MGPNETETNDANADITTVAAGADLGPADLSAPVTITQPEPKHRPVEHATVVACGHKLEAGHLPRMSNCPDCWYALFETTPEGVQSVYALLLAEGIQGIRKMHGDKFAKHFGRYLQKKLATLHEARNAEAVAEPQIDTVVDITAERADGEKKLP